ncbi:MAG: crossover junction endodeoxyribonuclease RuvC [Actinomycetota bacterium]|nr:crossover junction endodeoxyribonuclease RuvC [Actinomycetota bacterium]
MKVLGIDPGISTTGIAIVEKTPRGPTPLLVGVIRTPSDLAQAQRLSLLRTRLLEILDALRPDVAAVERLFFNANVKTAMAVGQASGVALATCADRGLEVLHYTPTQVKQSVVGVGSADKKQVAVMVAAVLCLKEPPRPADAADACALAICHINRSGLSAAVQAASR